MRRRRRILRGAAARAGAAVLASPVGAFVVFGGAGPVGASGGTAGVLFRPVLCVVPPYDKLAASPQPVLSAASCGPSNLSPASMQATPSKQSPFGFTYQSPRPALILEGERTTTSSRDMTSRVVLLGGLPGSSVYAATISSKGMRYLLGPAVMSSRAIASATAVRMQAGSWVVDWTTTPAGSALWDRVARASFHRLLALDVGGVVVSAPIIEPTEASFTSFNGRGQVSGNWTQAEATRIAAAMRSGG